MKDKDHVAFKYLLAVTLTLSFLLNNVTAAYPSEKDARKKRQLEQMQKRFEWWPTDATPGPVKDLERGGYWWWPKTPGKMRPWGNRGYVYVYKIIYDYKEEELPPPKPKELRPSLLIKKIHKNVKVYFDYDKSDLRSDHTPILENAIKILKRNPEADILITGNCDRRGSESYNLKLGARRGEAVKQFMLDKGISPERVRIVSRGKLDAVAPITDIIGMQKDRNAQFMIAEVEEIMIPHPGEIPNEDAELIEEGKYLIEKDEKIESQVKVSTEEYIVKKGDTLSKIAKQKLGAAHRWKYLFELNKATVKNPNKLKVGEKIVIPIE